MCQCCQFWQQNSKYSECGRMAQCQWHKGACWALNDSVPCTLNTMPIGRDHDQLTSLPSLAVYLCLQDLVDSLQQEMDTEAAQHQASQLLEVTTELWRKRDLDVFVEAIHLIRAKAPDGGFKPAHFWEVSQILAEKVPNGMIKSADQLRNKYNEVHSFLYDKIHSLQYTFCRSRFNIWPSSIVEWKNGSGIGGHLDGDLTLPSQSDEKVYDDFVKSLRQSNVCCIFHIVLVTHS